MPGRVSTPSDPSLKPEDWQQIWRRLKNLCLVSQRANSRLRSVTARPDEIFGDAVTFARYKDDIYRRKRYLDIEYFSSFVSISDVTHPASQSTELRILWGACLLHPQPPARTCEQTFTEVGSFKNRFSRHTVGPVFTGCWYSANPWRWSCAYAKKSWWKWVTAPISGLELRP